MATDWANKDVTVKENPEFLEKVRGLKPSLLQKKRTPEKCGILSENSIEYFAHTSDFYEKSWKKGDSIVFDFGEHMVGYFSFRCDSAGSPPDAPGFIKLSFCEIEEELWEDSNAYNGWLSKGWLQEEWLHLDSFPNEIKMERRYACRYAKIEVLDTSQKYEIVFNKAEFNQVSAVDMCLVPLIDSKDELIKKIDEASIRTLQNCMQEVYEDGPKRDRRLWLGDLKLQAMVNYKTFRNFALVKRCLYLFAGLTTTEGAIAACVFHKPSYIMDDTFLLDYSLFFISVLLEYCEQSGDKETLKELSSIAFKQLELASNYRDDNGIFPGEGEYHCFVDWNEQLDKQCAMQAIYIYSIKQAAKLAELGGDSKQAVKYLCKYEKEKQVAMNYFWDEEEQVFVSGKAKQISIASQVWMILAGVIEEEKGALILDRVKECSITMVSPYMNHYYVEALMLSGKNTEAMDYIRYYWGGMIGKGADTFWELFNPQNPTESPYGSRLINSYCHAWSCTPAYFFRTM